MKVIFWQFRKDYSALPSPTSGCRCACLGRALGTCPVHPPCVHATHPYSGCVSCTQGGCTGHVPSTLCLAKGPGPGPMAQDLCEDDLLLEKEATGASQCLPAHPQGLPPGQPFGMAGRIGSLACLGRGITPSPDPTCMQVFILNTDYQANPRPGRPGRPGSTLPAVRATILRRLHPQAISVTGNHLYGYPPFLRK